MSSTNITLLEAAIDQLYEEIWDGISNGVSIDELNEMKKCVRSLQNELIFQEAYAKNLEEIENSKYE
jgi:hypothetical protein